MGAGPDLSIDTIEDARRTSLAGAKTFYLPAPEPGLRLRFQKGRVIWVISRRRANGARVPLRIGVWPQLSIEAACDAARIAKLQFAKHQGKPLKQRSIADLLTRYDLEKLSQQRSGASTRRSLGLLFRNYRDREVRSFTRHDLEVALGAIATTSQSHANRCLAYRRCEPAGAREDHESSWTPSG